MQNTQHLTHYNQLLLQFADIIDPLLIASALFSDLVVVYDSPLRY